MCWGTCAIVVIFLGLVYLKGGRIQDQDYRSQAPQDAVSPCVEEGCHLDDLS